MADTKQRGASGRPGGGPAVKLPDPAGDRLPFARAASVIAVVVLAGALFGYDQGVISGALLGIQKAFAVGAVALEIVTSWVTLGAMFGSLAGGYVADHFGRKRALLVAAGLFILGALVEAFAPDVPVLVFGRLAAGFGVGVAAVAAPLYAAELAPAAQRGRFVSSYQLAITIGIFLAYLIDEALAGSGGWRLMLGISAFAGVLLALAVLLAVESPAGSPRPVGATTHAGRWSPWARATRRTRGSRRSRRRCGPSTRRRRGRTCFPRAGGHR